MRSTFDLLVLRFFALCVPPLAPPPPPMRSVAVGPPAPGRLSCARADEPGAITKAVVTIASNIPLKRVPMTNPPKSATAPCRLTGTIRANCRQGHGVSMVGRNTNCGWRVARQAADLPCEANEPPAAALRLEGLRENGRERNSLDCASSFICD